MQAVKIIDFCFRHRATIRRCIDEKRRDPGVPKTGGAGSALRSDPTCQQAIRHVSEIECVEIPHGACVGGKQDVLTLRHPERWLKVIDLTTSYYDGKLQGKLIKLKYIDDKQPAEICAELRISRALYYIMQNDIFCFASGIAAGLGLAVPHR